MEKMSEELLDKIENALKIKFYEWQLNYLLSKPMVLDMRMTGRCTGKTIAFIIKQLFEDSEPLYVQNNTELLKNCDWWSCENRIDRMIYHPYLNWYLRKLIEMYKILNDAGIITREVIYK